MQERDRLKDRQRIVIKVGSSTITHKETGNVDYTKLEKLVRILTDIHNQGKEVVLVSSGAIAVGRQAIGLKTKPRTISCKQACAAIGQASLMTTYQKLFSEYNQPCAQILLTKFTFIRDVSYQNATNTLDELFQMGVIPVVNENDTISTDEIEIGDNDTLSAYVAAMIKADLLILMSDIEGLYTDDPNKNKDAKFIAKVEKLTDGIVSMGKDSSSNVGTGGMQTKLKAAGISTKSGADMVICNGEEVENIRRILAGEEVGTWFLADYDPDYSFRDVVK